LICTDQANPIQTGLADPYGEFPPICFRMKEIQDKNSLGMLRVTFGRLNLIKRATL
jgi:hypothetical protein